MRKERLREDLERAYIQGDTVRDTVMRMIQTDRAMQKRGTEPYPDRREGATQTDTHRSCWGRTDRQMDRRKLLKRDLYLCCTRCCLHCQFSHKSHFATIGVFFATG